MQLLCFPGKFGSTWTLMLGFCLGEKDILSLEWFWDLIAYETRVSKRDFHSKYLSSMLMCHPFSVFDRETKHMFSRPGDLGLPLWCYCRIESDKPGLQGMLIGFDGADATPSWNIGRYRGKRVPEINACSASAAGLIRIMFRENQRPNLRSVWPPASCGPH
jgi:hypothetical protein